MKRKREVVKTQEQEAVCTDIVYVHKGLKPGRWLLPIGNQGFQGHPPPSLTLKGTVSLCVRPLCSSRQSNELVG